MKFSCKTKKLKDVILKLERVTSKQTTLPILQNILIKTQKGRLVLAATNLEISLKTFLGAKIEKEGQITLPPRVLGGFLNAVEEEVVDCELLKGDELKLTTKKHQLKIKGIAADDFPIIPEVKGEAFFELEAEVFSEALSAVLISVSSSGLRQELNSVFIKLELEELILASTDSFRLTEVKVPFKTKSASEEYKAFVEKNESMIIPAGNLLEFQRILTEGKIGIKIDQNQLFINTPDSRLISRTIDGNYPEYQQIIPDKYEINIEVDRRELVNTLKIASLVLSNSGEIQFKSEKENELIIETQATEEGLNTSKIAAKIKGGKFDLKFNCRYLLNGLTSYLFSDSKINIFLNPEKSPVMFKGDENKTPFNGFFYLVMPIVKD